jgi:hypothetical protein
VSEFAGYYVQRCGDGGYALWTVGFDWPGTARWEPESDHLSEVDAERRAAELNGTRWRYAYMRTDRSLWTVGEGSGGSWLPVSDHTSEAEAAAEVIRLNS